MWYLDVPRHDPDSNYPEPSAKQILYADQARGEVAQLKATLEKLTVPQQRAILNEIRDTVVGGVYRKMPLHVMPDGKSHECPYAPGEPAACLR
jgi:hypothetical protein